MHIVQIQEKIRKKLLYPKRAYDLRNYKDNEERRKMVKERL